MDYFFDFSRAAHLVIVKLIVLLKVYFTFTLKVAAKMHLFGYFIFYHD